MLQETPHTPKRPQSLPEESRAAIERSRINAQTIRPAYEDFCFANLPGLIEEVLVGATNRPSFPSSVSRAIGPGIERVVLVLIDAFGWDAVQRYQDDSAFLRAFQSSGISLQTTSQFPSTTAAHITCINSGLPVYESGVCEWFYLEPNVDSIINPFRFKGLNSSDKSSFLTEVHGVDDILPKDSFSRSLGRAGVRTTAYGSNKYFPGDYDDHFIVGEKRAYQGVRAGVQDLLECTKGPGPAFHYFYIGNFDSACHHTGPSSAYADKVARVILRYLEPLATACSDGKTLLMLTADHGQISLCHEMKLPINKLVPGIEKLLRTNRNGELIRYGGGPRDMLLYAQPGATETLADRLRCALGDAAEVLTQQQAAAMGILGPTPISTKFRERMGDVIVLPKAPYWGGWEEPNYEISFYAGHHGGLTPQEMITPLLLLRS
jgi:predicted AlkP superfamily pyrophosphatase or phosphodiesterase